MKCVPPEYLPDRVKKFFAHRLEEIISYEISIHPVPLPSNGRGLPTADEVRTLGPDGWVTIWIGNSEGIYKRATRYYDLEMVFEGGEALARQWGVITGV
jgi:hypothetical protein